jgi:outer membrane protein assembly factor BamB
MFRSIYATAVLMVVLCSYSPLWAARNELLPETTAARHGLTRPWFAQVEFDQGRAKLCHVILYEGVLYAQTDSANVHAIDAETGKTLWSKRIGRANYPSFSPDADRDKLAIVNGSRLYIVNRLTGELLCERDIQDAPGASAALSGKRAYVPLVTGLMLAYNVDKIEEPPLACQSSGRALIKPLVTRQNYEADYVAWTTDLGFLNFGRINRDSASSLTLKYRLATGSPIVARPAYQPPDPKVLGDSGVVFAASSDGIVFAVQEEDGGMLWQFPTSEPIIQSPQVIDNRVYVTTELGGMYCLDAKTGKNLWWTSGAMQFIAASKARVYATDRVGRILVFEAVRGGRIDAIPVENVSMKLANSDSDRIYLVGDGGMIQCLHEVELTEPVLHGKDRKDAAKAAAEAQPAPEPKKTDNVEKTEKKTTHEPKTQTVPKKTTVPKEKPAPKERVPRTPRTPKKTGKKGEGDDNSINQPADNPGGPGIVPPGKNNKNLNRKKPKTAPNL